MNTGRRSSYARGYHPWRVDHAGAYQSCISLRSIYSFPVLPTLSSVRRASVRDGHGGNFVSIKAAFSPLHAEAIYPAPRQPKSSQ